MADKRKSPKRPESTTGRRSDVDVDETPASRIWVVLAALAIVALAVVLIVTSGSDPVAGPSSNPSTSDNGDPSAPSSVSASSSSVSVNPSEASVCGLTDVAMSGGVTEPPQATWSMIGSIAAPSIEGQGPGARDSDGYLSCFARTPTGALLAASTYVAMGSYGPWLRKYYERAMVPGPGRDALLKQPVTTGAPNGITVQIAGFNVLRYTGQIAEVDIALKASDGSLGAKLISLQWSGGDWKIVLHDTGEELSPVREIDAQDEFVSWSAGL